MTVVIGYNNILYDIKTYDIVFTYVIMCVYIHTNPSNHRVYLGRGTSMWFTRAFHKPADPAIGFWGSPEF